MNAINPLSIRENFESITDPRVERTKLHKLEDILTIAICAVICGADEWVEIELFGKSKKDWLSGFLELPYGIPSHDTFGRVFAMIEPENFRVCFMNWVKTLFEELPAQVVPIDGKTLRRSHDKASGKSAIHMVSAWASSNGIVLGQVKTAEKSNEITAIPELLKHLELKGCTVTIDAMGCQKEIASQIVKKEADYALALKGNQAGLHSDVKLFFDDARESGFKGIPHSFHENVDGGHGRVEIRRCWAVDEIDWLCGKEKWEKLKTIAMIESERHIDDKISKETRFYISSHGADALKIADIVRSHWAIENSLHWILDVSFQEDGSRIRKGNAPENFAVIRHMALNLLKSENSCKLGIKAKRRKAGWNTDYLAKVLAAA